MPKLRRDLKICPFLQSIFHFILDTTYMRKRTIDGLELEKCWLDESKSIIIYIHSMCAHNKNEHFCKRKKNGKNNMFNTT